MIQHLSSPSTVDRRGGGGEGGGPGTHSAAASAAQPGRETEVRNVCLELHHAPY